MTVYIKVKRIQCDIKADFILTHYAIEVDKYAYKAATEKNWFKKFSACRKAVFPNKLVLGFYILPPGVKSGADSLSFFIHTNWIHI